MDSAARQRHWTIQFETFYFGPLRNVLTDVIPLVLGRALMRFRIAPFVVATLLVAVSVFSAQIGTDTTTSQYEALRHSILVLKFGRSPEGQEIPSPDCFNRAQWDR